MSENPTYQLVAIDAAGDDVQRFEVPALPLRPQDVLVVRPPEGYILTHEEARLVKEQIEARLPGQRVLVFVLPFDLLRLEQAPDA